MLPELAQHVIVISVTIILIVLLLFEKIRPAYVFSGAVLIFLLTHIISVKDFLNALSNESILSIFLLIFLTYGLRTNFNILKWMDKLFGNAKNGRWFALRMTSTVAVASSFLNNTPIVALFMPYVYEWSKKRSISPSKLMIPLSYAAMVGGMITIIGTSTNLVLQGLVQAEGGTPPGLADYFFPGVLVTIGSVLYLTTIGYSLLPDNRELLLQVKKNTRSYMVNVKLSDNSTLSGQTVREAGLSMLDGVQLFEIIRQGVKITPVRAYDRIYKDDTLIFVGDTEKIINIFELEEDFVIPELQKYDKETEETERNIIETVIPANSVLVGQSLKEVDFNKRYDAVVIGIHRNGVKLEQKIGLVPLMPGDLLLMVPGSRFKEQSALGDAFYMVSVVKTMSKVSNTARYGFLAALILVIAGMVWGIINLFLGLLLLLSYMLASKMLNMQKLKEQFGINLFIVLVGSLAFSTALINSGVAEIAAGGFMRLFNSFGNKGIVIGVFAITLFLTSFVTNVAAVAIVFPIAFAMGSQVPGLDMTAIYIAMAFAASASFHTPFSYQTNMMVYGPGGYRFSDFLKAGGPLTLLYSVIAILFILFYYQV